MKKKMTPSQTQRAKRQAERLKGEHGVDNPHALARWQIKRGQKVGGKRRGR